MARKKTKLKSGWMWSTALLFGAGYLATSIMKAFSPGENARYITGLIVLLVIPFAARTRKVAVGLWRGVYLGLAGSIGMLGALMGGGSVNEKMTTYFAIAATSTLICSAVVGALFAHLADKRYKQLYGKDS